MIDTPEGSSLAAANPMLPVEHVLPNPSRHPWRTIAVVAAGIATLELVGLVVAATALLAKPVAHRARARVSDRRRWQRAAERLRPDRRHVPERPAARGASPRARPGHPHRHAAGRPAPARPPGRPGGRSRRR